MTSKQRLLAAARRKEVDTIPISPRLGYASTLHFGANDVFANLRLKTVYDYDPHFVLGANNYPFFHPYSTFQEKTDVRTEISISEGDRTRKVKKKYSTPEGTLSEEYLVPVPGNAEFGEFPNPIHTEHLVKEPADLKRLRYLMPDVDVSFATHIRNVEEVIGEEGLCLASVYGALDHQAGAVMSMEDIMIAYYEDREFAVELVAMFQKQLIAQTKLLLENGVKHIFAAYYYHSLSAGWSPQIYREWFMPLIKEQADLVHSYDGLIFFYDDGKHMQIMPYLIEAGIDVVETCTPPPVGDFDLAEAKRLYGNQITLKGYIDLIYVLQKGTVDDVRKAVKLACEVGGRNGGFVLGTSDSMRAGTPRENIDAYFEYGRKYGR